MSAEILREAAALMREQAEAATQPVNSQGWIIDNEDPFALVTEVYTGPLSPGSRDVATTGTAADAAYIAAIHPAVALAVADWLDAAYADWHRKEHSLGDRSIRAMSGETNEPDARALTVALTYLGRQA